MKIAIKLLILLAIPCLALAGWGIYTPTGRTHYDEMAGIIPFMSGVAGLFLVGAAAILLLLTWFRQGSG
ncbi:MAG: hypothetical protein ABJN26_13725 [Stappiaceae bacterium]